MTQEEKIFIEQILDRISDAIIIEPSININPQFIKDNQKTVRDGIIRHGRDNEETLLLYQKDIQANEQDLLETSDEYNKNFIDICKNFMSHGITVEQITIQVNSLPDNEDLVQIILKSASAELEYDVTSILSKINDDGTRNPVNVSQFVHVETVSSHINKSKAEEYLDTNIYELLPGVDLRQTRIDNAISELRNLLPQRPTAQGQGYFPFDPNSDGSINRDGETDPYPGEWYLSNDYYLNNSIVAAQNNEDGVVINEEDGFITRLTSEENSFNQGQSIQSLRNDLNSYLLDIDEEPRQPQDDRTVYSNKSEGYLKFRNLNQGIIIRNTNQDFIEGLNPETRDYLETGFTITMWVRFLDKTSEGTLFNFGNPMREDDSRFGFKLDTFVLSPDTPTANGPGNPLSDLSGYGPMTDDINYTNFDNPNGPLFKDTDTERFVRLVVYDNNDNKLYGSHTANAHLEKTPRTSEDDNDIPDINVDDGSAILAILNNVRVPSNLTEWYFICATYNPSIDEINSFDRTDNVGDEYNHQHLYWLNHINPINFSTVTQSEFGNRCKVEIISRSDLLRARGYKVD